ncbi:stalk domain-containing protein [Ammoniphilus sp. CFH 90114]|uniref:stalk domain-containing protein n=1 Tax=Ammoniphilus sp. CFH 90114 TaxID=2493665 RepID=UPI00100E6C6F|nr:stalk domain-containing protein [Ammoniphilus sp. CFH 90114]RXT00128.1 copper amine oxidase [Ammoniphilus sp. CFH 90114]
MFRYITLILLTFFLTTFASPSYAEKTNSPMIHVYVDALPVEFDVNPIIQNGRTLVPFRKLAETLDVQVEWDHQTRSIYAKGKETEVKLVIGNPVAFIHGVEVPLEAPPIIEGGRTLIPLRFFSEAFQADVKWDHATREIHIISPKKEMKVLGYYALKSWESLFGAPHPHTRIGNTDLISDLAVGWYSLDESGNLLHKDPVTMWAKPDQWEDLLQQAENYSLNKEMTVLLPDTDQRAYRILSSEENMTRAIYQLLEEAKLFDGINLDIEGLGRSSEGVEEIKNQFSLFVRKLSEEMKKQNLTLTLTLHAPNSAFKGYDYNALSQYADRIVIMAYGYSKKGEPEPIHKVIEAVKMAKNSAPEGKFFLGLDMNSENEQTLLAKLGVAKQYQLEGIALWRLGLIQPAEWEVLKKHITK